MRIAVFGSGGVGGYFGGRLAQAGQEVVFIARGAHLAALREHGLRVASIAGDFSLPSVHATDDPAAAGPVDVVLVAVKAWQLAEAARVMPALLGPETMVVPLENGVEAPDELAATLGAGRVLGGLCRILAWVAAPGEIRHAGVDPYIAFGELDRSRSGRVARLRQAFAAAAGLTVEVPPDIRAALWGKFLFITPVSAVGALTRVPIGTFRAVPETRRLLREAMEEIAGVAAAAGVNLPADAVARTLAFTDTLPADATASMQRDLMEGRPSELEAQVGAVLRTGARAGYDVPVHRMLYAALLPLERQARGR